MKKRFTIVFLILIISGSFVVLYNFPKSINIEYPAVEFRAGDISSVQKTTIRIKGTLFRPLFRNNKFRGQIIIDKYDFTKTYHLFDITFYKNIKNGLGTVAYYNEEPSGIMLGTIWKLGYFENLKVLVNEPVGADSGAATNLEIIAPAKDYDTALVIHQLYKY